MFEQKYICNKDYLDVKGHILFSKGNVYTGYIDSMKFLHILAGADDIEIQDASTFSLVKEVQE